MTSHPPAEDEKESSKPSTGKRVLEVLGAVGLIAAGGLAASWAVHFWGPKAVTGR
jgi:hypothetical protein